MVVRTIQLLKGADLFCGAGGTSTGVVKAMRRLGYQFDLAAINHWAMAIATHKLNHPSIRHFNSDLERVDPREVVPSGHLDFLWASPECTYYSNALGGKPVNNQSRATPKWVIKWLSRLDVTMFFMENVPEFRGWGPVHQTHSGKCTGDNHPTGKKLTKKQKEILQSCHWHKPIKNRRGEYFYRFVRKLESLGYKVEYRVLCAADYGAPTTRRRLFLVGSKDGVIKWPEPKYSKPSEKGQLDMFAPKRTWKTAKDHVIDWSLQGESIFFSEKYKKKPLSPKSMKRILQGFYKVNGKAFVMSNQSGAHAHAVDDEPVPTLTASGHMSLFEPYIMTLDQGGAIHSVEKPLHTVTSADATTLVEPYLVSLRGTSERSVKGSSRSANEPAPSVTGSNTLAIAQPYIISHEQTGGNGKKVRSAKEPVFTVTGSASLAIAEPYIIPYHGQAKGQGSRAKRVDQPLDTVAGENPFALAQPYIVEYYGNGTSHPTSVPIPTVTGNDRFALAIPVVQDAQGRKYLVDIRYRMFTKKEYARAQGFPSNYKFKGGSKAVMKQIGNAVPPVFAEALTYVNMKGRITA